MTARKDQEADFIAGIYNYCDRWCERCPATSRCMVFYRDNQKRESHLEKGEDPDDLDTIIEDVREDFQEVIKMISEETNVPLEELEKHAASVTRQKQRTFPPSTHPLRIETHNFAMKMHGFL